MDAPARPVRILVCFGLAGAKRVPTAEVKKEGCRGGKTNGVCCTNTPAVFFRYQHLGYNHSMSQSRIFPFRRVSVDHMVRGVTRVWWQLETTFNDPGPYYFQLQVGNTGLQNANDWKNVGGPVTDNYVAYDDEWRNTGGVLVTHYRVLLTTTNGAYVSQAVSVYGEMEEREWVLSREIVRKERLRHDKISVPGYLVKAMRYGTPCRTCRDQLTQEVTNFDCPICSGTGFEVGYFPPLPMQCWDLSPQTIQENQDAQMKGTTREQAMITARTVGFPQIDKGDIWVNAKSDERWIVMGLKVAAAMRGVPIVYEVTLGLIPISSTVYLIEVGGEPADRPGPVLPLEGCGIVAVDHDFGGPDALAYQDATGCAVVDASVYVFKKADYDAALPGLPARSAAVAATTTRVNGRWAQALQLDPGDYVVLFEKFSEYGPDVTTITVVNSTLQCVWDEGSFGATEEPVVTEAEEVIMSETQEPFCKAVPTPPSRPVTSSPPTVLPSGAKKFNENDEFWNM